jgi:transcription initiation factor TFIID subunit 12
VVVLQVSDSEPPRRSATTNACTLADTATPAQITRSTDDATPYTFEETRTRRKNTPGDQSMRRSIQDLVASIDPNVRIEPEVEDVRISCFPVMVYCL